MKLYLLILFLITNLYSDSQNISLQLSWKNQFQFAGFYIAKEKGFYKDVDLNVTIKEYFNSVDVVRDVAEQKSTYGVGKSSLLIHRNNGIPVVALLAIYQSSPSILVTTNPNIKTPSDLVGKKVMITGDEIQSASITTMLLSYGVSKENLILQDHSSNYKDLINNKTDAMACYLSNEPYYLDLNNIKYTVFNPKEHSYDFYGDILFTSEKEIKEHPLRVKAFRTASTKGWLWAFQNIEQSAQIIYEKYNTQNKSLESLIYEGYALKELAIVEGIPFGNISLEKFDSIAQLYKIAGLLESDYTIDGFFDTLEMNKYQVNIGVLAKRGKELTLKRWSPMIDYLNKTIETHHFSLVELDFNELEQSVKNKELDFVITNTAYYVLLENRYGVSRIATLLNANQNNKHISKKFGSVIFVKSDNTKINKLSDLKHKSLGVVSKLSFGGWIVAYEELLENNVNVNNLKIEHLGTHDAVVKAVISGKVEAGVVRTDTLEQMAQEGTIKLSQIKVLGAKKYKNFPYLASTKLYPEWPIAKLSHANDALANQVLSKLIMYTPSKEEIAINNIAGWTVPLDYSSVHNLLRKLKLPPYDKVEIKLSQIITQYSLYIYSFLFFFLILLTRLIYQWRVTKYLKKYSDTLNKEVASKTHKLREANEKLKIMANVDALTGISNRGHFMKFAKKYFDVAKRNKQSLEVLSLDLDNFKNVNDTYGHAGGDLVLQEFTKTVSSLLRESDIFGRIGGEEFCVVLQNTAKEGSLVFANRICKAVENMLIDANGETLKITVSIGMATMDDEKVLEKLIEKSDIALYEAKNSGRNRVVVYSE